MAAVDLSAGATISYEHNTNPIELGTREARLFAPEGKKDLDDTSHVLTANVAAKTSTEGPLQMGLHALYSHSKSERFNTLGHTDYNYGVDVDWKPSPVFDMSLAASQNREPVGLADIGGQRTAEKTTSSATGVLRVRPTSQFQLGYSPGWSKIKLPLQGADNYQYDSTSHTVSLDFIGAGRLVPGLAANETTGGYSGIGNATEFRQRAIQGTLNYKATGFSTFSLAAGQAKRTVRLIEPSTDPDALATEGTHSGFMGSLTYDRQLSPKTGITVSLFRAFQEYETGVGTEVRTGLVGGIAWNPTSRISVTLNSEVVLSKIDGMQFTGNNVKREDLLRSFSVGVGYLATRLVSVRTYVTRRIRNSNGTFADQFNANTAGVELGINFD